MHAYIQARVVRELLEEGGEAEIDGDDLLVALRTAMTHVLDAELDFDAAAQVAQGGIDSSLSRPTAGPSQAIPPGPSQAIHQARHRLSTALTVGEGGDAGAPAVCAGPLLPPQPRHGLPTAPTGPHPKPQPSKEPQGAPRGRPLGPDGAPTVCATSWGQALLPPRAAGGGVLAPPRRDARRGLSVSGAAAGRAAGRGGGRLCHQRRVGRAAGRLPSGRVGAPSRWWEEAYPFGTAGTVRPCRPLDGLPMPVEGPRPLTSPPVASGPPGSCEWSAQVACRYIDTHI